ncbi:MAG: polyphosphate kinase 2 family protein [Myxococcales bacterium]|jgi:polyphosphate kinase 2 (PPK2 family)|nr:polyphosphate kinase [Sphingomicrobium sp.]
MAETGSDWLQSAGGESFQSTLGALGDQVAELQLPQIAHGRRAIILLEGPDGSGKKAALKQIAAAFDPCHFSVYPTGYERREASEGHWLARFWRQLPSAGRTSIFYRSWYRRVLDDRVLGRTAEESIARAFDEINEFEVQQRDYGTLIVKLYFTVDAEVQERRLAELSRSPWRNISDRDEAVRVSDPAYSRAFDDVMAHSNTRWSPWRKIDGNDEAAASIGALEAIADAWSSAMPSEPPHLVGTSGRVA